MNKILISGDSWGFAVYDTTVNPVGIIPEAFGHQLTNRGYDVENVSVAGSNNNNSVRKLSWALDRDSSFDTIIWVQTDPFRDLRTDRQIADPFHGNVPEYNIQALQNLITANNGSIVKSAESLLNDTYNWLNTIAARHNKVIHCLGGCVTIADNISKFEHLRVLMKSIPEFLIPGHKDSLIYDTEGWLTYQYIEHVKKNKIDLLQTDWYAATDLLMEKNKGWSNCVEYFNPDQWHPNAAGHRLITDFIVKTLA